MKPGEKIMKTKKVLSLIFLFFLLFFNAFAIISAYNENHKNYEVISKEVTIIEKYTIGSPADSNNYSKYMTGEDDEGNQYKIPNQTADIGDKITIYANPNSANYNGGDREWHTSETGLKNPILTMPLLSEEFTIILKGSGQFSHRERLKSIEL